MADGFTVELHTWNGFEIPDLAQLVKQYAAEIGVTINLKITDDATLLRRRASSESRAGSTRSWASPTTATGRCRTCISTAVYTSKGTWNAAHFKNPQADDLDRAVHRAHSTSTHSGAAAKQIQELLLDETPV